MTQNQPTLTPLQALTVALAAWIGLALALVPAARAVAQPFQSLWLALDGLGLTCVLTGLPGLQFLSEWQAAGSGVQLLSLVLCAALLILLAASGLRSLWRLAIPHATELFVAGLCVAYLGMPLLHHVLFTDGYYYISDSANFFSRNHGLQVLTWAAAALLSVLFTRLRRWLERARRA